MNTVSHVSPGCGISVGEWVCQPVLKSALSVSLRLRRNAESKSGSQSEGSKEPRNPRTEYPAKKSERTQSTDQVQEPSHSEQDATDSELPHGYAVAESPLTRERISASEATFFDSLGLPTRS